MAEEEALKEEEEVAGDTQEEAEEGGEGQEAEAAVPTTRGLTRMARPESRLAMARSSSLDLCNSKLNEMPSVCFLAIVRGRAHEGGLQDHRQGGKAGWSHKKE